ncbi:MAG: hypothetical protein OXR62_14880 [Ahrensia sp.]|nr:hypothetical protein [Ahrensia sp.]
MSENYVIDVNGKRTTFDIRISDQNGTYSSSGVRDDINALRTSSLGFMDLVNQFNQRSFTRVVVTDDHRDFPGSLATAAGISSLTSSEVNFPSYSSGTLYIMLSNDVVSVDSNTGRTITVAEQVVHAMGHAVLGPSYLFDRTEEAAVRELETSIFEALGITPVGLSRAIPIETNEGTVYFSPRPGSECFLAGTPIDMWPGADGKAWQKPIEDIRPDDWVVSYDEDGKLVPGRVSRTMQNRVKHILDVHGLMMTPGHVTYCAKVEGEDNKFGDSHVPVLDILRSDGAMMKKDGSLIRASTGAPVGSLEDRKIWAVSGPKIGNQITVADKGQIRLGTRFIMEDGSVLSVLDMIARMGAMLNQDGVLVYNMSDKAGFVFHWEHTPMLPKPEDYVLQRSALTLNDIYAVDEWEAVRPRMPAPVTGESGPSFPRRSDVHYAASPRGEDVRPPNIPLSMRNHPNQPTMSRQQRRALKRKQQKAQTSAAKRAQKAKRAATLH